MFSLTAPVKCKTDGNYKHFLFSMNDKAIEFETQLLTRLRLVPREQVSVDKFFGN